MSRLLPLYSLTGCFVSVGGGGMDTAVPDAAPTITYADASCYWDRGYDDYVWYFEADVDDWDGTVEVAGVYADVYDQWTGEWVDAFELYPEAGITWYSAWVGQTTYLDCEYYNYTVEFTAEDVYGAQDIVDVELQ